MTCGPHSTTLSAPARLCSFSNAPIYGSHGSSRLPRRRSRLTQPTAELRPPSIDRHRRFPPRHSLLAPRRSSTRQVCRRFTASATDFRPTAASYAHDGLPARRRFTAATAESLSRWCLLTPLTM
jgi:hypothetical protein